MAYRYWAVNTALECWQCWEFTIFFFFWEGRSNWSLLALKHFNAKPFHHTDSVGGFWLLGTELFPFNEARFLEGARSVHRIQRADWSDKQCWWFQLRTPTFLQSCSPGHCHQTSQHQLLSSLAVAIPNSDSGERASDWSTVGHVVFLKDKVGVSVIWTFFRTTRKVERVSHRKAGRQTK